MILRAGRLSALLGWAIVGGLLIAGAALRLTMLPAVPLVEWDSAGWLNPALSWVGGGALSETYEREWLYGAFLAGVLKLGGSLSAIVWVQWLCGLLTGALLFAAWRTWLALLPVNWWNQAAGTLAGLVVVASFLLNIDFVVFEMSVRPESLLGLSLALVLLCSAKFFDARWLHWHPARALCWGAAIPLLGAIVVTLKPSWALGIPVMGLPLLLAIVGPRSGMLQRALPLLLGCLAAVLFIVIPGKLVFERQAGARVVLPMTLLTIHADAVLQALTVEEKLPSTSPERKAFLNEILPILEEDYEVAVSEPYNYVRLGYDPDYIMYRGKLFPYLVSRHGYEKEDLAEFCFAAYRSAWFRAPLRVLKKVFGQMTYYWNPDHRTYTKSKMNVGKFTAGSREVAARELGEEFPASSREMYGKFRQELDAAPVESRELRAWKPLHRFLKNRVPPNWLMLSLVIFAAVACVFCKSLQVLQVGALGSLFFFALTFGNALTIAIVHALDNDRYRISYGPLVLFAIAAGIVLLWALVGRLVEIKLFKRKAKQ